VRDALLRSAAAVDTVAHESLRCTATSASIDAGSTLGPLQESAARSLRHLVAVVEASDQLVADPSHAMFGYDALPLPAEVAAALAQHAEPAGLGALGAAAGAAHPPASGTSPRATGAPVQPVVAAADAAHSDAGNLTAPLDARPRSPLAPPDAAASDAPTTAGPAPAVPVQTNQEHHNDVQEEGEEERVTI
jgi:hypothetical protein